MKRIVMQTCNKPTGDCSYQATLDGSERIYCTAAAFGDAAGSNCSDRGIYMMDAFIDIRQEISGVKIFGATLN
jgi:hypothetical protein